VVLEEVRSGSWQEEGQEGEGRGKRRESRKEKPPRAVQAEVPPLQTEARPVLEEQFQSGRLLAAISSTVAACQAEFRPQEIQELLQAYRQLGMPTSALVRVGDSQNQEQPPVKEMNLLRRVLVCLLMLLPLLLVLLWKM